jgi:hypothetical protein
MKYSASIDLEGKSNHGVAYNYSKRLVAPKVVADAYIYSSLI